MTIAVSRARSRAAGGCSTQSDRAAPPDVGRQARRAGVASSCCTAGSTTPTGACRSISASKSTWGARHAGVLWARPVAYFSAEFGMHESLPIYSGGLGILAGDHIKSASDLGIPLVGVGLFYDQGYFRQRLDVDGWQHEDYIDARSPRAADSSPRSAGRRAGHRRDRHADGHDCSRASGSCRSAAITLLLLDSNVEGNQPEDRELTARLYGGDQRVRIRQELLLGVGGVRALGALGISPGRAAPERRPQRVRRPGNDPAADDRRRASTLRRSAAARRAAGRVHDAHAGAGRSRSVSPSTSSRSISARCATRSGCRCTS